MIKILVILSLTIVTTMVNSQGFRPSMPPNAGIQDLIKADLKNFYDEYIKVRKLLDLLRENIVSKTEAWLNLQQAMIATVWIRHAPWFIDMQRNRKQIQPNCLAIQESLFQYGTLVGNQLKKCVASHRTRGEWLRQNLKNYTNTEYETVRNLHTVAKSCTSQPSFDGGFACLSGIQRAYNILPKSVIAVQRYANAAHMYYGNLERELEACPYLANLVDFENRAIKAASEIEDCLSIIISVKQKQKSEQ